MLLLGCCLLQLASVMSEMLKSAQFLEKQPTLESAYQSTIEQGTSLNTLLKSSPDGTHDSQIAEKVTERMKHLTNLHRQIQPLIGKAGSKERVTPSIEKSYKGSQTSEQDVVSERSSVEGVTPKPLSTEFVDAFEDEVFETQPEIASTVKGNFQETEALINVVSCHSH